jgi:hypothetical protein
MTGFIWPHGRGDATSEYAMTAVEERELQGLLEAVEDMEFIPRDLFDSEMQAIAVDQVVYLSDMG